MQTTNLKVSNSTSSLPKTREEKKREGHRSNSANSLSHIHKKHHGASSTLSLHKKHRRESDSESGSEESIQRSSRHKRSSSNRHSASDDDSESSHHKKSHRSHYSSSEEEETDEEKKRSKHKHHRSHTSTKSSSSKPRLLVNDSEDDDVSSDGASSHHSRRHHHHHHHRSRSHQLEVPDSDPRSPTHQEDEEGGHSHRSHHRSRSNRSSRHGSRQASRVNSDEDDSEASTVEKHSKRDHLNGSGENHTPSLSRGSRHNSTSTMEHNAIAPESPKRHGSEKRKEHHHHHHHHHHALKAVDIQRVDSPAMTTHSVLADSDTHVTPPASTTLASSTVNASEVAAPAVEGIPPTINTRVVNMDGPDAFDVIQMIGRGDVGRVYLVRHKTTGMPFAMKTMSKQEMLKRKKIHRILTEREILLTANHPFIVTLHYSFQTQNNLYFIMDFCGGGEFFVQMRRQGNGVTYLTESVAKFYAAEVLVGLEYLHMMGIIYRDLKPENILFHESGHIMLSDFNLSKQAQVAVQPKIIKGLFERDDHAKVEFKPSLITHSFVGTEEYVAPEVITGFGHTSAVDWWTFGILLYEMLFGKTPFKGKNRDETFAQIVRGGLKLPDQPVVSKEAKDLVKKLLCPNPKKRLGTEHGAADVKVHPFFHGVKWQLLLNQTPPIKPQMDHPFDTRNFRTYKEVDQQLDDFGDEKLSDAAIANEKPYFREFTTVKRDKDNHISMQSATSNSKRK